MVTEADDVTAQRSTGREDFSVSSRGSRAGACLVASCSLRIKNSYHHTTKRLFLMIVVGVETFIVGQSSSDGYIEICMYLPFYLSSNRSMLGPGYLLELTGLPVMNITSNLSL